MRHNTCNQKNSFDLIVVGGGIAGTSAAIAAGREGLSVLLIEEQGFLGGSLTACGTGPMMTFHAGNRQVIRGIPDELIQRLKTKELSVGHIPDSTGYTYSVTPFDAEGMKRELELMAAEARVTILYHAVLIDAAVSQQESKIESIKIFSCGNIYEFFSDYFIDATGDADLTYISGAEYVQGRTNDNKDQPMTLNFKLYNVDINKIRELMESNVNLFPFLAQREKGLEKTAVRLSCSGFVDLMKQGRKNGEFNFDRDIVLFFETNTETEVIINMTRVLGENPVEAFSLSRAEIEGRRQMWDLFYFLKKNIPGFANSKLMQSGPNIGIRSSRRIKGEYTLTAADIVSAKKFPDMISLCGYPIDIHSPDGTHTDHQFLTEGTYYGVPYRCLQSSSIKNLLAAGRNISCEFEAHASLRVSPSAGAIGQAAGTAASLAFFNKIDYNQVDIIELRRLLTKNNACVD
ncbi:FAD-dependent oxidoreductase [Treponema sp. HNW]|uniref:FAD-dependent oxidoreductase n=1 Tax=Treponema sp. HNW TaxID=3116654 RepID=UPI003D0CF593